MAVRVPDAQLVSAYDMWYEFVKDGWDDDHGHDDVEIAVVALELYPLGMPARPVVRSLSDIEGSALAFRPEWFSKYDPEQSKHGRISLSGPRHEVFDFSFDYRFRPPRATLVVELPDERMSRTILDVIDDSSSTVADEGRTAGVTQPTIFIGHGGPSQIWRVLKDYVSEFDFRVVTFESEFRYGRSAAHVVWEMLQQADFALLVHTADDETKSGTIRSRQNVVHETGLFQGRLGFEKAIIVRKEGVEEFSNLAGIQEIRFPGGNIEAASGEVLRALRSTFPAR
ncbi:TIR domain-containing protein [Protofrankia symbiont of Coriaria ruscifolia]|uniref:TIR domain-containing protein n=1 Tax=Protofrankia symbiont of Coriaria ruscifolia TaxID=1306542 RepID=UPI0013EFB33C|nr:nucleotide-binding protein [Protofrankia symbiont of Coriaria ruscifolia]